MSSSKKPNKFKSLIDFCLSVLTLLKWLPFLMKWRPLFIALSAILGVISGLLSKCDTNQEDRTRTPTLPSTPDPETSPTPTHTPTPTPTPKPRIIFDRIPRVAQSFSVIYTAPFRYNLSLYVDQYRLQTLGKQYQTGYLIAPSITLMSWGNRRFSVRDESGNIIAETTVEVLQ